MEGNFALKSSALRATATAVLRAIARYIAAIGPSGSATTGSAAPLEVPIRAWAGRFAASPLAASVSHRPERPRGSGDALHASRHRRQPGKDRQRVVEGHAVQAEGAERGEGCFARA